MIFLPWLVCSEIHNCQPIPRYSVTNTTWTVGCMGCSSLWLFFIFKGRRFKLIELEGSSEDKTQTKMFEREDFESTN